MTNMIKDSVNESLNNHIDKFVKNQSKKTKKEQEELSYIIESLRNEPTNNRNILNSSITKKFDKRIKQERKEELSNSELLECYQDLMTKNAHLLFYMNLALSNPETLESVKHRYVETICNRYINKIGILDEMDLTVLRKYHNILPNEKGEKTSVRKYDGVMKKASYNIVMATAKKIIESTKENEDTLQRLKETKGELLQLKREYIRIQLEKEELLEEEKRIVNRLTELTENYLLLRNQEYKKCK